jgi:chromosome segregation ATPase
MLRESEARMSTIKQGHDELIQNKRTLQGRIDSLENQVNALNSNLDDYSIQIQEKEQTLEEIRKRVTTIAELFEKKPIKQRYSFEVLCDFVHDKAKRLFSKYENAIKDRKNHERTNRHQTPQMDVQTREALYLLKTFIVPQIMGLLNKSGHMQDIESLNIPFMRQLVNELDFEYNHHKKEIIESNQTIASNLD